MVKSFLMTDITAIIELDLKVPCQDIFYFIYCSENPPFFSFLDSSLIPNKYSKYSYIAWEPDFSIKSLKNELIFIYPEGREEKKIGTPMILLKDILKKYISGSNKKEILLLREDSCNGVNVTGNKMVKVPDFTGGFIGYLSYDLKDYIERLPNTVDNDICLPFYYFSYYSRFLAFDHDLKKWYLVINFTESSESKIILYVKNEKQKFESFLSKIICTGIVPINEKIKQKYLKNKVKSLDISSDFTKEQYIETIKKAKKYIHAGDIYQVNITQRFTSEFDIDPVDLYYILRQRNSAPFSAFLGYPDFKIGSSSPERFLFLKNGEIETRPIKGTRPRGKNTVEDNILKNELKASIKDRAELNMIVDLERNDLGKFCRYGTVKVKEHAVIEKYSKVFHSVSTITGELQEGFDTADIIKATFPGGSITGAPKIRAMQIIDELEPLSRNIYTGSIGYIGADGTLDMNIVIRTFIIKNKSFYYNVGGGIVEDSDPEDEYQETLDKGLALKETLEFFNTTNLL